MLRNFLWVGLGGGIGAMLRFLVAVIFKSPAFPVYTMLINIVGSFFIGMIFAATLKDENFPEHLKFFLATGLCGGFTTFSAFSLENMQLIRTGNYFTAVIYIAASVAACLVAVFAGFKIING
jgi:CrcB protein